jgi:hypothetical protein
MRRGFLLDSGKAKSRPQDTHASPSPKATSTRTEAIVRRSNVNQTCAFLAIPIDILLKIFNSVALLERARNRIITSHARPKKLLPVRLSHVSSLLRSIVLNRPLFWTTFDFHVIPCSPMVEAFLTRSQSSPIDIYIEESYLEGALRNMSRLVHHVHRWRRLYISGDSDDMSQGQWMDIVTRLRYLHAPNLKYLQLSMSRAGDAYERNMQYFFTFAGGTPSLTSLSLTTEALCFPVQRNTLTTLSLHTLPGDPKRMSYAQFCDILASMSSLTFVRLIGQIIR